MFGKKEENNGYFIAPADGLVHALLFKSQSTVEPTSEMVADEAYNIELNNILAKIQGQEQEIVDIKLCVTDKQAGLKPQDTIRTLILYK